MSTFLDIQRSIAIWILKTRELHRIPVSVMNTIIFDVESLFEEALGVLRLRVESAIRDEASPQIIDSVTSTIDSHSSLFSGLKTERQQVAYFKKNFNYIVSLI